MQLRWFELSAEVRHSSRRPRSIPGALKYVLLHVVDAVGSLRIRSRLKIGENEQEGAKCPSCHEPLPQSLRYGQEVIIGLVGGPSSGKTQYLTALIEELAVEDRLKANGCTQFTPVGDTGERYRSSYYNVLFGQLERFGHTQPLGPGRVNRPLVYEMTIESPLDGLSPMTYTVLFFDASGDQLDSPVEQPKYHKYVFHADGLILFADPEAMPKSAEWLQWLAPSNGHSRPWAEDHQDVARNDDSRSSTIESGTKRHVDSREYVVQSPSSDPKNVSHLTYQSTEGLIKRYLTFLRKPGNQRIDIPVAVTISKADELRYVMPVADRVREILPPLLGTAELRPNEQGPFRMIDVYTTSSRAMEILADIADPGLLRALGKFSDVTCHLVSSTDCAVNREGKYPRVQPRRVVEPLASILLRLKVL